MNNVKDKILPILKVIVTKEEILVRIKDYNEILPHNCGCKVVLKHLPKELIQISFEKALCATVSFYLTYMRKEMPELTEKEYEEISKNILNQMIHKIKENKIV
jgi:hypothetical protein